MSESEARSVEVDAVVQVRDLSARELDVRLMPWGAIINTASGLEVFERGAFDGTDPAQVRLMGLEHEIHLGVGQNGQPKVTRHPVGKAISLDDREDGQHATFRVSRTARGDEVLALADDGIASGVSVEFLEVPGGSTVETRSGRRTTVHRRVRLTGASTTYRPAYEGAVVLAVRSEGEPEVSDPVAEAAPTTAPAPVSAPAIDITPLTLAIEKMAGGQTALLARMEDISERSRTEFRMPGELDSAASAKGKTGTWVQTVLQMLSGTRISDADLRTRDLDDLITTDNLGVVPEALLSDMIGIIDPARPFLNSTRKLDLPPAGMSILVPKIVTRPTTDIQAEEKDELDSTATSITTESYEAVTIGGAGDLSLQLLKRSSPSFLALYLELLAESYAKNTEKKALTVLLASSPSSGGALDPEDAKFGAAWVNGAAVSKTPDTIWLSGEAVGKFIDAKADGTNVPLYSSIQAGFTAGAGPAGTISGLRPVYCPQLDAASSSIDAIVGPSSGFAWTEDGAYTLQVDVPAKAGRDVAIVGITWYAPMYPTAFTTYSIAS